MDPKTFDFEMILQMAEKECKMDEKQKYILSEDLLQYITGRLEKVDFSYPANQKMAEDYVRKTMPDMISGKRMNPYQMVVGSYLITKLSLIDRGLNSPINFKHDDGGDSFAYFSPKDKSVNFIYEKIGAATGRFFFFTLHAIQHEVTHAERDAMYSKLTKGNMTADMYKLLLHQNAINIMPDLYHKNHDEFYIEVDADEVGVKKLLEFTKKYCPELLEKVKNHHEIRYRIEGVAKRKDPNKVVMKHESNANNGNVRADYKASLVLDRYASEHDERVNRNFYFEYTHNQDGTKKTLEQVENARLDEIKAIPDGDASFELKEIDRISKLYDTIIDCDPILSLEKSLKEIAEVALGENGKGLSPAQAKKVVENNKTKARELISIIEKVDRTAVDKLLLKYKKLSTQMKVVGGTPLEDLYRSKIGAFGELWSTSYSNQDLQRGRNEDIAQQQQEAKARSAAKNKLLALFAGTKGLRIDPYKFVAGENQIDMVPNYEQKYIIQRSVIKLRMLSDRMRFEEREQLKRSLGIRDWAELNAIINSIFPFEIPLEEGAEIENKIRRNELTLYNFDEYVKNIHRTKDVESEA